MAETRNEQTARTPPPPTTTTTNIISWPADKTRYRLTVKIGQGAFASVYKGICDDCSTKECGIKVLNLDHCESNLNEIRQEVQAMRLSSHRNVLPVYTAFVNDTNLWIVTPLMRKGSALHCIQTARRTLRKQGRPPLANMEDHIVFVLNETLLGLQYIHNQGQIHRDMKGGNILLDDNGSVRIADFGVSGWLADPSAGTMINKERAKTFVGTPCWMAPEVMEQIHGYDYKADIWSLGITALELAKGYAPYAKYPPMKVLILTIQEDPPSLDTYDNEDEVAGGVDDDDDYNDQEQWSKSFRSLIEWCLQKDPKNRPTCQELLDSKYFVSLDRDERQEQIRTQVCDLVPDIGTEHEVGEKMSGEETSKQANTPISILLNNNNATQKAGIHHMTVSEEEDRQPGTTWVFADGSQIVSPSVDGHLSTDVTVDDALDEIEQFGKQTGGENYGQQQQQVDQQLENEQKQDTISTTASTTPKEDEENDDDLNKFMDEFEQTTGGENFKKS